MDIKSIPSANFLQTQAYYIHTNVYLHKIVSNSFSEGEGKKSF